MRTAPFSAVLIQIETPPRGGVSFLLLLHLLKNHVLPQLLAELLELDFDTRELLLVLRGVQNLAGLGVLDLDEVVL